MPPIPVDWGMAIAATAGLLVILILGTVMRAAGAARLDPVVALRAE